MAGRTVCELQITESISGSGKRIQHVLFNGKRWRRYPDSKRRSTRHYFLWSNQILHRAVYEAFVGQIPEGFHIHHKDENTDNNDPENLEALSPEEHNKIHQRHSKSATCLGCGAIFETTAIKPGFCTDHCRTSIRRRKRKCEVCSAEYEIVGFQKSKTCSRQCNYQLRSVRRKEMHAAKRIAGEYPEPQPCVICGTVCRTAKVLTCSRSCELRNRSQRASAQHMRARLQPSD